MNKEIFTLLCCPETKQEVTEMTKDEVKAINKAIAAKKIRTVAGKLLRDRIETALIREDKKIAYPIRKGIPIMLIDEGFDPSKA